MANFNLTPNQQKIADHKDGALIVLAGAGSGKTATLVARVGNLLNQNISPRTIQLTTFSRKAAKEIRTRLVDWYGMDGEDVVVDTFHGFGYRFMKQYKDLFGLKPDQEWAILADNEQKRLYNEIGKNLSDKHNADAKDLRKAIKATAGIWSMMKQDCVNPANVSDALIEIEKAKSKKKGEAPNHTQVSMTDRLCAETMVEYEKQKRDGGYLDFDDLLLRPTRALIKYPEIAKGIGNIHQYMMIDESQDTNLAQYLMMRSIGRAHGNVVMVGDDDQSIYGWRGARVANLRRFMKDFNAPVARMEENFRSHSRIVDTASNLISHNNSRLPKKPFSSNTTGTDPVVHVSRRDRDMARSIVHHIKLLMEAGESLNDIAVLYRTNRMTTILEPELKQSEIPYSVVGGMSFYERSEIQAAMAIVRIVNKFDDWQALKTLQPFMDGLGKKGLTDMIDALKEYKENLLSFALHATPRQFGKGGAILQQFLVEAIDNTHGGSNNMSQTAQIKRLVQWMKDGPMRILDREKDDSLRVKRSENLDQLIDEIDKAKPDSYMDYLMEGPISDHIAATEDRDCITLSTIHRSKGLEWPHVMVAGFSDGLMPLDQQALSGRGPSQATPTSEDQDDDGGRPEEERRLAYVAATRAADTLTLYHANLYQFPGSEPAALDISPFVGEMKLEIAPEFQKILDDARPDPVPEMNSSTEQEQNAFAMFEVR
jgi:superfamily I DNA/RNA helicase